MGSADFQHADRYDNRYRVVVARKIEALLLIIGLLVSGWFFLNSLGQLMLANQISTKASTGLDDKAKSASLENVVQ